MNLRAVVLMLVRDQRAGGARTMAELRAFGGGRKAQSVVIALLSVLLFTTSFPSTAKEPAPREKLTYHAQMGDLAAVKRDLDHGADVNEKDGSGRTALYLSAARVLAPR